MGKLLFIAMPLMPTLAISAQSNRAVETQQGRYGHITRSLALKLRTKIMRRFLLLLTTCLISVAAYAQDNDLTNAIRQQNVQTQPATQQNQEKKTGSPVAVAPIVFDDTFSASAQENLNGMLSTLESLLEKSPKTYLEEDTTKIKYLVAMGLNDYHQEYKTVYDREHGKTLGSYAVSFYLTLYLWDYVNKKIVYKTNTYKELGSSVKSYEQALRDASMITPAQGRVRELIEGGLKVTGTISKINTDAKGKIISAIVDKGSNDGIIDTQWFDVYVEGDTANIIGTLHADEVAENSTICKVRKNKDKIYQAYQSGKKLIVISREESNAWKSLGRFGESHLL